MGDPVGSTGAHFGRVAAVILSAAVVAGGLAGCGATESSPGVTDERVTVGAHVPRTGPLASTYGSISDATKAYFDYVNDRGGVSGRKLTYLVEDDSSDPAVAQERVTKLVEEDEVFAVVGSAGVDTHAAVLDYLTEKGVPDVFPATGSPLWNQPEKHPGTFGFTVDQVIETKVLAHRIGRVSPDSVVCLLAQEDMRDAALTGLELVLGTGAVAETQTYPSSEQVVSTQVAALQAAGCETNVIAGVAAVTASAVDAASALGYRPDWAATSSAGDYAHIAYRVGGDRARTLLQGMASTSSLPFSPDDEWVQLFQQINADYNEGREFTASTVLGMSIGYAFVEALALAGERPTREGLLDALTSGRMTGNGLFPMTLSSGIHSAYSGTGVVVVQEGIQRFEGSPFLTSSGDSEVIEYVGEPIALDADGIPGD